MRIRLGSNKLKKGLPFRIHVGQEKAKLQFFPKKFNTLSKIWKNISPLELTRKIKQCKLALLCNSKKILIFQQVKP